MKTNIQIFLFNSMVVLTSIIMLFPLAFFWIALTGGHISETIKAGSFTISFLTTLMLLIMNFSVLKKLQKRMIKEDFIKVINFKRHKASDKELMFTLGEHK